MGACLRPYREPVHFAAVVGNNEGGLPSGKDVTVEDCFAPSVRLEKMNQQRPPWKRGGLKFARKGGRVRGVQDDKQKKH